ncbi:MAG: glycerophosphodiester phosphodiesterase [Vicinamibacterales bacterium]
MTCKALTLASARLTLLVSLAGCAAPAGTASGSTAPGAATPGTAELLIIGHRGAPGHRPEHTLESYRLAVEMGADYIEPDLVATKDGVLVARHENEIGGTTDVAVRFPDRKATKTIDGRAVTGWFTEDFTLAELRTLRARERLAFRSHEFDGRFPVPTLDEVIELAQTLAKQLGRPVGIYPETKHPAYFAAIGLALEPRLVAALDRHGWNTAGAPVFIQSFEAGSLKALKPLTPLPLVQLLDAQAAPLSDARLREIAGYARAVGLHQRLIVPAGPDGATLAPTDVVARAHAAGLTVHVWTLRNEDVFLSPSYHGRPEAEYRQFADLGVDGIFTDSPDTAAAAVGRRLTPRRPEAPRPDPPVR